MTDQPEKVYSGMIVNFGKGDGGKGNGFGFVESADRSIPDAYFNMPILERQGFPIPNDETKLNWLHVKYTVTAMPDGALRVATIQLDGDINYDVRSSWQDAAPEVAAQTAGDQPQRANAEAPTDVQHNNISGQVKWFDAIKGFGFIIPDDGGDNVFVHIQTLGKRTIKEGDAVTFNRSPNPRKGREGSWMASTIHTINGKTPIPKNIPADEIHSLTLDIREIESGLQLVLPPPYQQLSIPFDLKRDADVFASYPEHRIDSNNPLEDGEKLSGIRVWIKQNGEAMLLPKHYKPLVAKRPTHNRTPGAGRPEGNDGQK